jgi:hypothetical protein
VIAEPSTGDGVADEGRLVVVLEGEEGGPIRPVVDVVRRLGAQVVRHARRHGRRVVGGGGGPGGGGSVRDGSAPVDVVAGHAAAGAITASVHSEAVMAIRLPRLL